MATTTTFAPTQAGPFQFGATLDGQDYTCTVTWNLYRIGWYLNVYDTNGNLVVSRALVPCPPDPPPAMNLMFGYFTSSTMYFFDATQTFVVTP